MTVLIDGKDLILGRLCTHVAKKALAGETVEVVNVEKVIISGSRKNVMARYKNLREKGTPIQGPFLKRRSRDLFKRSLKKMLPYKRARGQEALARVKAYKGIPARFEGKEFQTIQEANLSKLPTTKYVSLQDVTDFIGGR